MQNGGRVRVAVTSSRSKSLAISALHVVAINATGKGAGSMSNDRVSDEELERLLENWGKWCRELYEQGHCASVESRYRSPQQWHDLGAPQSPPRPVDRDAALAVNRAWGVMPQPWKSIVRDWYVRRANPRMTCRKAVIPFRAHESYLADGRMMMRNLLTRQGWTSIVRPV
jgi:hypothetical protein